MVDDTRVIWERAKLQAVEQIQMYRDSLIIAEAIKELAENKLLAISGQHLVNP